MDSVYVPRLLDDKERVFIFYMYEFVLFAGGLGLGLIFESLLMGVSLGVGSFLVSRQGAKRGLFDVLPNVLYWFAPRGLLRALRYRVDHLPPSAWRLMVG